MKNETHTIAFVCLHGSAKSVLAAQYLSRAARQRQLPLVASASGIEPDAAIPTNVVRGMAERGFDVATCTPMPATGERLRDASRVVAFGCAVPTASADVEQWADCPAVSEDFETAWRYITRHVDALLDAWRPLAAAAATTAALGVQAASFGFDQDQVGRGPAGWTCGVTGKGAPMWTVEAEPTAPSKPNVLRQSGSGTFPWCVRRDVALADGFVEVSFKPVGGREDQAGGVVWRWKSTDEYYVARANALENNVSLYYTVGGSRKTIRYVDAPVAKNAWHKLRVEFAGERIRVLLDGTAYIELEDRHIAGPGAVGVWTKADSVTLFDDFTYGAR